jgi:hypothetical protein
MTEYIAVTGENKDEFEMLVNKRLAEGWQLQGGVSVAIYTVEDRDGFINIHDWYSQAMTRVKA